MSDRYRERGRRPSAPANPLSGIPLHWLLLGLATAATLIAIILSGGGGDDSSAAAPTTTSTSTSTTSTAATPPATAVNPATIRVTFLNASGINGFARQTADAAEGDLGYRNIEVGNAPAESQSSYVAFRRGSSRAAAQQVADDLGISEAPRTAATVPELTAALAKTPVVVVIGTEGTGALDPAAVSTTSNTPAAPSTPAPAAPATPEPSATPTTEATTQAAPAPAPDLTTTTPPAPDPTSTQ
jgi:LytR cell envelope-related transcriptional attenuator